MRSLERILVGAGAAVLAVLVSAGPALAVSYTGSFPVTVSHSQRDNGTFCLKLTDDGSRGFPHSGSASLGGSLSFGTFQVIGRLLVATIQQQGGSGQNAGLLMVGSANNGTLGKGFFEQVFSGEDFDSGLTTFGAKGGC